MERENELEIAIEMGNKYEVAVQVETQSQGI